MLYYNWIQGQEVYVVAQVPLVALSAWLLRRGTPDRKLQIWSTPVLLYRHDVLAWGASISTFSATTVAWTLSLPVLTCLLLGKERGLLFCAVGTGLGMLLVIWRVMTREPQLAPVTLANVALPLACIWWMTHAYETVSSRTAYRGRPAGSGPLQGGQRPLWP